MINQHRHRSLLSYWAKDLKAGFANINAKAEGIATKPTFRDAFQRRRCLVPVDNFYEWEKVGSGKPPSAIALADRSLIRGDPVFAPPEPRFARP